MAGHAVFRGSQVNRTLQTGEAPRHPGVRFALTLEAGTLRLRVWRAWPLSPGEEAPQESEELPTTSGLLARVTRLAGRLPRLQPFGVVAYESSSEELVGLQGGSTLDLGGVE